MEHDRSWMYNRNNPGRVGMVPEFAEGVTHFVNHAKTLDSFLTSGVIRCPCVKCENVKYQTAENVSMHLMMKGFKSGYTVWTSHGEVDSNNSSNNFVAGESGRSTEHNYVQGSRILGMVHDAFGIHSDFELGENVEEAPNEDANTFYEQFCDSSRPVFIGSPHSKLSVARRLLSIKSNWNLAQGAVDSIIDLMKELVGPDVEIPDSYYEAKKLVSNEKFRKRSEIEKKPHTLEKGSSLHTGGSISHLTRKKRMEKELGRSVTHEELSKVTRIKKNINPTEE